jgi:conjugative relaxase-like TrwC/TraI family protein
MTGGEGYAQRHLQQSDYYDQNRAVKGEWHGRGAELLGLKGEVTSEDFEAVRQGFDPQTGEFLRQRHGADRIASNGAEQSKARSLYDMTFSAPKSVSVMAGVGGDERLAAAHETAVREALGEAEKHSATRIRLAGLNENRTTGNWIVAAYTHDTSRELESIRQELRALNIKMADQKRLNSQAIKAKLNGELSPEDFEALKENIREETKKIETALSALESERKTMDEVSRQSKLENISLVNTWRDAAVEGKIELQETLFPEGLYWSHESGFLNRKNKWLLESFLQFFEQVSHSQEDVHNFAVRFGVPDGI